VSRQTRLFAKITAIDDSKKAVRIMQVRHRREGYGEGSSGIEPPGHPSTRPTRPNVPNAPRDPNHSSYVQPWSALLTAAINL